LSDACLTTQELGALHMDVAVLLRALEFAASKHRDQRRKDKPGSPYINHLISVVSVLANVGKVTDRTTLVAGALHDTLEDTATTGEELEREFGREVRLIVEELTDDKQLPKAMRKWLQTDRAPARSPRAKLVMLADKISNARDITRHPPAIWSPDRRREYLDWTQQVVAGCRGVSEALERYYDDTLREARESLAHLPAG
jgi:(p)ppGpp synthase/HD superfamily hydrolase